MFEILFIFGVFGWLLGAACEYLSNLAAFPTILTASLVIPLLASADYLEMLNKLDLGGLSARREPVPPERFYWNLQKPRLLRTVLWTFPLALAAWVAAIWWPASLAPTAASLVGWLAGLTAVVSTARFASHCAVYVRASRWFDKMAPWAIGVCRRTLYRYLRQPGLPRARQPGTPGKGIQHLLNAVRAAQGNNPRVCFALSTRSTAMASAARR